MKKLLVVIVLLGGLFVTSGCQGNTRTSSENTQNAQSVESTERSVDQKQLTATIVITNKGFITSIDGMSQDQKNNVFWVYTVNNEMSDKGAQNLLLKKDDTITFNLQAF